MNKKTWLRVALLAMSAIMLLTVMAGCGEAPAQSDPDTSDFAGVSTDAVDSTTTGDAADTTTDNSATGNTTTKRPGLVTGGKKTSSTAHSKTTNKLKDQDDKDFKELINPQAYKDHNSKVAMPTRKLANNTVVVFSWRDQQSDNCYGGSKPDLRKVYKDVGLKTEWYQASHANYSETLAAVVASGNSPDLVEWNAAQMYPASIAAGLVQPLDPYIDWEDDIWKDVMGLTARYQIKGNTYFSVEYMQIDELVYYDPTIIKAAGLKTPKELWEQGKWTLKELQKIADKTVQINQKGEVTRYGFVPGDIGMITGLEMVEYSRANGYKLNITNSKYKTLMNIMEKMGVNGTRSAGFTTPGDVGKGNVVMSMTAGWGMTNEMNDARVKGRLEWCVLPRLDDNSKHYYNLTLQQTFGLITGAKNPEGAAYLIELRKWAFLNYPWLETLPFTGTQYTKKYGEKMEVSGSGDQGKLTAKEIEYSTKLINQDYEVVAANLWGGWVKNGQFPGITEVVTNGNKWSTVLANKKATLEAVLKKWDFSKVPDNG